MSRVTKEIFRAYVEVQVGGRTNMWDQRMVESLSGGVVDKDSHLEIIKRYSELSTKFGITTENVYE